MTTISDALKATLDSEWGNGGGGGTKPTLYCSEDLRKQPLDSECYIIVHYHSEDEKRLYTNDEFADYENTVTLTINTAENAAGTKRGDRLKEISDEVKWIVLNAPITGATRQDPILTRNTSAKNNLYWREEITVKIYSIAVASATVWGSGSVDVTITCAALTFVDGGETVDIIRDEDNMVSDDEDALATQQSIKAYVDASVTNPNGFKTITGITNDVVADAEEDTLTLSSANNKLTIVGTTATDTITFTIDESNIDHDTLTNFAANEHFLKTEIGIDDLDDTTLTGAHLEDLLMFGSANQAYVPCIFELETAVGKVVATGSTIKNVDATEVNLAFRLPIPSVKGGLKLYVSGVMVGLQDADESDYLTRVIVRGLVYNGNTIINDNETDYTAPEAVTQTFTAVDCSGYNSIWINVYLECATAGEVDISYVNLRCHYAA